MLLSRQDLAIAFTNSLQLWLPVQGQAIRISSYLSTQHWVDSVDHKTRGEVEDMKVRTQVEVKRKWEAGLEMGRWRYRVYVYEIING